MRPCVTCCIPACLGVLAILVNGRHGQTFSPRLGVSQAFLVAAHSSSFCSTSANTKSRLRLRSKSHHDNDIEKATLTFKVKKTWLQLKQRLNELSFSEQMLLALAFQWIYTLYLPTLHIQFPFQLLPVESGFGVDIGVDTILSVALYAKILHGLATQDTKPLVDNTQQKNILLVVAGLWGTFFISGYVALLAENLALLFSAMDVPIGPEMLNSIRVLGGHLFWVAAGSLILDRNLIPLFQPNNGWFRLEWNAQWLLKSIAGYCLSCTCYNIADLAWGMLEPFLKNDQEYQECDYLPQGNEWLSTIIGAIGPCISAPWFEEVLYRSFALKALGMHMPRLGALVTSSLLFAAHHLNLASLIQLFTLGLVWAAIQERVDNLAVTIAIHALWNLRVLVGNILGR
ncbi:Type II CAAX prenyl endopeptidase Rce1-like [Babesia duncani]|uniref:Type II CAAX prenyl endopeptidase Rce1-like n=1 Tax=Babesia duncani TaxID=323732 RepID=A0AAD9PJM2_9APIC|nr:Type II CAAX prenyl endopeptidase Rce1-like [Babesia duncani]